MKSSILVTGGTGFIGRHLVIELLAKGYQVRVLTRTPPSQETVHHDAEYILGDFTRPDEVRVAVEGVDAVFHLAITTTPGNSNNLILFDAESNLIGSLQLIQAAANAGVRRFVFVSSGGSVYGPSDLPMIPETHPTEPISAHGISKLAVEKYLEIFHRAYGLEYRVARGGNPFGEWQDPKRGQGFISSALWRIALNQPLTIWGDGSVVRDFFYVRDFVIALLLMLDDQSAHRIYNVGSGQGISLSQLVPMLESVTGRRIEVHYEPGRAADVAHNCLDVSRIQKNLGWSAETSLLTGIGRTWRWIQSEFQGDTKSTAHPIGETAGVEYARIR